MFCITWIDTVDNPFKCFYIENVSFSSQEINMKQRLPTGRGKKNNALVKLMNNWESQMKQKKKG
jgi:hypothetical protein